MSEELAKIGQEFREAKARIRADAGTNYETKERRVRALGLEYDRKRKEPGDDHGKENGMTEAERVRAEVRYGNAQQDERRAREAHDQVGADRAKAEQVAAMDELHRLQEETRTGAREDRVTLVCPNPNANLVDANGITFVGGRAEGVPLSLARKYVEDLDGYTMEESA